MEHIILGVVTPLLLIGFYVVLQMVKYNPLNENTTIQLKLYVDMWVVFILNLLVKKTFVGHGMKTKTLTV